MKRRGYLVGGLAIGLCALTAAYSLNGSATRHSTFAEAKQCGETCQIYGRLDKRSIRMERKMTLVTMTLREEKTGATITAVYDRPEEPVPANLSNASDVRAIGIWNPATESFRVSQLYTKCPSKYQSEGLKLTRGGNAPVGRGN